MVAVLGFSKEQIKLAVQDMYTVVADQPESPLHFPIGRQAAELAGYTAAQLGKVPQSCIESFAGVGCPFRAEVIRPGDTVLDLGAGSGTDVMVAAGLVGEQGLVIALDITAAMRDKLKAVLNLQSVTNVEVIEGDAESIPLPDNSVDVVTSNGVLNLVPNKRKAIKEIFRVLKPGGHVQIADIVISNPVTPDCEDDPKLWAECVVGATVDEEYLDMFKDAGFRNLQSIRKYDYFSYSPSEETQEVAKQFGAYGLELKMDRPETAPPAAIQWIRRLSPVRLWRRIQRRGLLGTFALMLAMLSCYGTLAALALLSIIGVVIHLNESIWAGTIVFFTWLTCVLIVIGIRKHRTIVPLLIGIGGAATITYTSLINYHMGMEMIGFALLGWATFLDYSRRRWAAVSGGKAG